VTAPARLTQPSRAAVVESALGRVTAGSRRAAVGLVGAVVVAAAVAFGVLVLPHWPHMPTHGAMLWGFGVPVDYQECGFHTGQDWFAAEGTPVFAIADGVVMYVGPLWSSAPGTGRGDHAVVMEHEGYTTTYSHNRIALVSAGEPVERGQVIAEVGNEGYSRRPHLHLEKVEARFSGDWTRPFDGCDVYVDPGMLWSPF